MMGEGIEQRRCHLGIAEDGSPFAEAESGGDDVKTGSRSAPIKLSAATKSETVQKLLRSGKGASLLVR